MQLEDTLVENFVGLLAGKIEHFDAEPAGISGLIDETPTAGVDHDAAG